MQASSAEEDNDDDKQEQKTLHIFDDSDFYTSLLKDVADNRLLSLDNEDGDANFRQKVKKPKKVVDTKASKGRKLRFVFFFFKHVLFGLKYVSFRRSTQI